MLSKVQKGESAVAFVTAKLMEAGFHLLRPLCEDLPFDLVILDGRLTLLGNDSP